MCECLAFASAASFKSFAVKSQRKLTLDGVLTLVLLSLLLQATLDLTQGESVV
jgi:hypothetical protein